MSDQELEKLQYRRAYPCVDLLLLTGDLDLVQLFRDITGKSIESKDVKAPDSDGSDLYLRYEDNELDVTLYAKKIENEGGIDFPCVVEYLDVGYSSNNTRAKVRIFSDKNHPPEFENQINDSCIPIFELLAKLGNYTKYFQQDLTI
jgi:hypothetical protein